MKKFNPVTAIAIAVLFSTACSSSKKSAPPTPEGVYVNREKLQGKTFTNIFIFAMTADITVRVKMEDDLVNVAKIRGYKAVRSLDLIPFDLHNPKIPTKEELLDKIKSSGCDAVFAAAILKKEEKVGYTEGGTAYAKESSFNLYGDFWGYYSNWTPSVSTPSYYSHDKEYFVQSNFYEASTADLMWSVQSEVFNPDNINEFSRQYTNGLFDKLEEAKILKK